MKFHKMSAAKLKIKCTKYLETTERPTPRHFRVSYLKCTKDDIAYLKENKKHLYDVINKYEDLIMAKIEQELLWSKDKKQVAGLIFILRSYDPEQYAQDIKKYEDLITKVPYKLEVLNRSNNKLLGDKSVK